MTIKTAILTLKPVARKRRRRQSDRCGMRQSATARIQDLESANDMLRAEVKRLISLRDVAILALRDIARAKGLHPPRAVATAALMSMGET